MNDADAAAQPSGHGSDGTAPSQAPRTPTDPATAAQTAPAAPPRPPQKAAQDTGAPKVNPLVYQFVLTATYLPVILMNRHLEVHGREHIPPPGTPLVVAANHEHALDPFLIARAMNGGRYLQFMAKEELFRPIIGRIIRAGGSFPVDREGNDVGAVRTALRILKENGTVGIFPEGHRGGTELHGGVALIAAKGRAPILPAGLSVQGRRWIVRFGPVIEPKGGIKAVTAELGRVLDELAQPIGEPVR